MIVVFDANIWLSHLYANAPLRASALLYLRRKGASVALPEVVRLEVERHLKSRLREFRDKARANYDSLLKVFGKMKAAGFPSDIEIDAVVGGFFSECGFSFREVPFSAESARDSFLRTVDKLRPSHKSQQFKDGVIWADCIQLANEDSVLLVASDKAFYEDDQFKSGLATELLTEAARTKHGIRVFASIYDFIEEVREPLVIDEQEIIAAAKAMPFWSEIARYCSGTNLTPTEERLSYEAFATEMPNVVALACDLRLPCTDETGEGRQKAEAFVTFDCQRNELTGEIGSIAPQSLGIRWVDAAGEVVERRNAYMYAETIVFGHADVVNRFRQAL